MIYQVEFLANVPRQTINSDVLSWNKKESKLAIIVFSDEYPENWNNNTWDFACKIYSDMNSKLSIHWTDWSVYRHLAILKTY